MRMGLMSLALGTMLAVATSAQAAIIVNTTNLGTPTRTGGSPDSLPGYTAWLVSLDATGGDQISAFDFWTQSSGFGLIGPTVQRWSSSGGDGTYDIKSQTNTAQNNTTGVASLDSHWIFPPQQVPGAPDETNNAADGATTITGHPSNSNVGWGLGNMYYSSSVGTTPLTHIDLAYVILPNGQSAQLIGSVARVGQNAFPINSPIPIPEPTSLSLLALGGLAMLRRRR